MSRTLSVCLCAVMTFVALYGVRLFHPDAAYAATGTLTMETPLHDSPSPGAPLIALVPAGTVVSIDGPPVDGFYPVSTTELSGWMRGETMQLQKDEPGAGDEATPAADEGVAPVEQTAEGEPGTADTTSQAGDQSTTAPEAPAGNQDAAPTDAPVATPDETSQNPGRHDGATNDAAVSDPVVAAATPADPAPADPAADLPLAESTTTAPPPDATVAAGAAATPIPLESAREATEEPAATEPPADPDVTPIPVATPGPSGPGTVTTDMPIRSGPGPDFGLIFTVPQGSTVEQTGQVIDGWVSVQYKEVSGWAPLDEITEPVDFQAETMPKDEQPVETKTPKPGSGVAFTTVDLSLRAGPSATEEPVAAVPAGSRVILTGVMEGGFQRVTFGNDIGWIADEYLQSPNDPAPNGEAKGQQENYSERQIVRYIYQAADRYDQPRDDMLRVARCESNLDPYAVNPSGSYGLFQFIRTTWKSTPYGDEDIFDPQANANAAGWMWAQGRKSEWVCQ